MTREGGAQVDDVHRPIAREVVDVSVLMPVHAGVEAPTSRPPWRR